MSFTQMNNLVAISHEAEHRRALLDKAIIGMGSMVELIDHIKPSLAGYDPEAGAVEALELVSITQNAVHAERQRIIKVMRDMAEDWTEAPQRGNKTVIRWLADQIEGGTL